MAKMSGRYQLERNENLDEYFKAVGVPFIPRKMMCSSSPVLDIVEMENGEWKITSSTYLRTTVTKFKLDEEYEEHMPGGVVIKSTTKRDGNTLTTVSVPPDGSRTYRIYTFDDTHCILHLTHEKSGKDAKRYFKRI